MFHVWDIFQVVQTSASRADLMVSCFGSCCSGMQEWMQVISVWLSPQTKWFPWRNVKLSLLSTCNTCFAFGKLLRYENCSNIGESEQLPRDPIPTFEEPPAGVCQDLSGWVVPIYSRYLCHWWSKMIWKSLSLKTKPTSRCSSQGGNFFLAWWLVVVILLI